MTERLDTGPGNCMSLSLTIQTGTEWPVANVYSVKKKQRECVLFKRNLVRLLFNIGFILVFYWNSLMLDLKSNSDSVKICLYYVMKSREPRQEIVHGLVAFTGGGIVASKSFILRSLKATGNSKLRSALNMQNHTLKISISIGRICHKV